MDYDAQLVEISGVGDQLAANFKRLGLNTVRDLIDYYPRRYDDFSVISKIGSIRPGQVTIAAQIKSVSGHYLKRGLHITEALASDDSGSVRLTWFNQPYRETSLKKDTEYFIVGKYELRYRRFAIYSPVVEAASDFPINTARIVPRYPETKGLNSGDIRRALSKVTDLILKTPETLPEHITKKYKLASLGQALMSIHFPKSREDLAEARRRLGFEELFMMLLASQLNKQAYDHDSALKIGFDEHLAKKFVAKLPFNLTDDQRKAIWQIYKDQAKSRPMNRLVEGDVGSGKTAVAAMAALMVVNDGRQAVFMAPTELLARQHAETVNLMFKSIGLDSKVGLLIGALSPSQKSKIHKQIKDKQILFVIGTHALIQEKVETPELALVIIDEQHRFGVNQRQALKLKAKTQPHMLSLSATPIPRSLALTLFGELNISRLIDKPTNRLPVITDLISESELTRKLTAIEKELKDGRQVFIVSSNIDTQPKYSVKEIESWARAHFKNYRVGIVHGRLSAEDKAKTMQDFSERKLDILVATTVIEVGIDVPNATVMLIFDADSFGLAQLHQLRGRVGRGQHQGYAYLIYPDNQPPSDRLKALEASNDGFKLAELDLSIRGPGAIYGQLQHGLLDLRIAGLDDTKLIREAREAAIDFIETAQDLKKYPQLYTQVAALQKLTNLN
ncbi:MAG TPA: ATP-dependent DNA helicase RecG [Candidatus Saccharimonadales bacterium]|jgi:ATP-dependent DNA helicase RecG